MFYCVYGQMSEIKNYHYYYIKQRLKVTSCFTSLVSSVFFSEGDFIEIQQNITFQLEIGIPTISLVYLQNNHKYVHT